LINVTQHSDSIWFSFAELIECFLVLFLAAE
jgi:hypothetical protein